MIKHRLTIGGEDVSEFLIKAHIEKWGDIDYADANAEFTLVNLYGMFTGKWRDEGSENVKIGLVLVNERNTCVDLPNFRYEDVTDIEGFIENEVKEYHAFCGYIARVDYDEQYVIIKGRTAEEFLEEEPMPDGVKPKGGTAYIAWKPSEIILDIISQHKDPPIEAATLTRDEVAQRNYPVLKTPANRLPNNVPKLPSKEDKEDTGGSDGDVEPGKEGVCPIACRYKQAGTACKSLECPYKHKDVLCRQVSCPYDLEKRKKCFGSQCPYNISKASTQCSQCSGLGYEASGSLCSCCAGSGYSTAKPYNYVIKELESQVALREEKIKELENQIVNTDDPAKKGELRKQLQEEEHKLKAVKAELIEEQDKRTKPFTPEGEGGSGEVAVDFWDPPIIKDQVQATKAMRYADAIRMVTRATGGTFYIDEYCKARFIPPGWIRPTPENQIDITHLVTKQGLGKNAMGHANIVVVYGSGITDPGRSPAERERHKVVGYLEENVDSIRKHGTVHAAEVDMHYLPKQEQITELAKQLIDYYKTEADKAIVEAIGISPYIFQKIRWKIPIGPIKNSDTCDYGSTAIMAVVEGRVNRVVLDYSASGWTVEINASTEKEVAAAEPGKKPEGRRPYYTTDGTYLFTYEDVYQDLYNQMMDDWNKNIMPDTAGFYWSKDELPFDPKTDFIYVKPDPDAPNRVSLYSRSGMRGQAFGKAGDKPPGAYLLRGVQNPSLIGSTASIDTLLANSHS